MARLDPTTPATRLACDRLGEAVDDVIAGRPTFPSGTVFIGADQEGVGESIAYHVREQKPIVIVYPDGAERFLVPSPHPRAITGALGRLKLRLRHRFG